MNMLDYNLAYASVQGPSHKKNIPETPCQDASFATILENGWHLLIASDGAGSAVQSHLASSFCVEQLASTINKNLPDIEILLKGNQFSDDAGMLWEKHSLIIFGEVRDSLLELSKTREAAVHDFHCTLLVTILTPAGFLTAHIGDGRAGFYDGKATALMTPFMTFVAGATYFLIKEEWDKIFRAYVTPAKREEIAYFFVATDGCQQYIIDQQAPGLKSGPFDDILGDDAFYDSNIPYHDFFEGLIKSLKEVEEIEMRHKRLNALLQDGVYELEGKQNILQSLVHPSLDDDKTLLIFFK